MNEYNRDKTGPSIEFREEEFDKAETVDNLFYLAELDVEALEEEKNSPSQLLCWRKGNNAPHLGIGLCRKSSATMGSVTNLQPWDL